MRSANCGKIKRPRSQEQKIQPTQQAVAATAAAAAAAAPAAAVAVAVAVANACVGMNSKQRLVVVSLL